MRKPSKTDCIDHYTVEELDTEGLRLREELWEHVQGCARCRALLEEHEEAKRVLSLLREASGEIPSGLRSRLARAMAELAAEEPPCDET